MPSMKDYQELFIQDKYPEILVLANEDPEDLRAEYWKTKACIHNWELDKAKLLLVPYLDRIESLDLLWKIQFYQLSAEYFSFKHEYP